MKNMNQGVNLSIGILALFGSTSAQAETKQPNIIFILADDFGWNDLGCMGSRYYETPNLDRLAQQGVMFTNAYAACQVSSPSRASILTGKYTTNHGITNWIGEASGEAWRQAGRQTKLLSANYKRQLADKEYTMAECLRDNGYDTFFAGKWHLGEKGSWPEDHGFDVNVGGWTSGSPNGGYFPPYQNPNIKDEVPCEQLSMRLSRETASYIAQHNKTKNGKNPFFAYLSFYAVHGPIQTTQSYWEHFRNKADSMGINPTGFMIDRTLPVRQVQDNPIYAGLIKQMDDAIGYLLNEVDRLGLGENTIIVFTSDNGGVTSGDAYSTSLLPLRGGKGRQWEGGLRVPMMIRTPNSKSQNTVCNTAVSGIDFYPTIMDLAGISYKTKQQVDGVSLKPLLNDKKINRRPLFWHYPHYGNQGGEPCSIVRDGDWKLIYYHEDSRYELYNLSLDLGENKILNSINPDKVIELKTTLNQWLSKSNAIMPTVDSQYDSIKSIEYLVNSQNKSLGTQETSRKQILSKDWKPNKDWWGSQIIND